MLNHLILMLANYSLVGNVLNCCPCYRLQERLLKKLGSSAFAFNFTFPRHSPTSVILQPAEGEDVSHLFFFKAYR